MDRELKTESVEGEIALIIDYVAGESLAVDVLQGAMQLIQSLDKLDRVLLSSVDTNLEPVSILNDVQHSSLKMMLARGLRRIPDDPVKSLDWKKWVGRLSWSRFTKVRQQVLLVTHRRQLQTFNLHLTV